MHIIVGKVMSCKKKMVMNCLDDWCTEVVQFCRAKSKYKDSPLMASPSVGNAEGCAWRDDSFRGTWCKYDVVSGGLVDWWVMQFRCRNWWGFHIHCVS